VRRAEGGLGGEFRPPYKSVRLRSGQVLGEISSNFFERTPPVGKCLCWLALHRLVQGSPADFERSEKQGSAKAGSYFKRKLDFLS